MMPASNPEWSLETVLARAHSMVGAKIPYVLQAGGRNPTASSPIGRRVNKDGTVDVGCDCSGFTAWCAGFDRYQETFPLLGGWINTDSTMGTWDAKSKRWQPVPGWFEFLAAPVPGCFVVYGGIDFDHDGDRDRIGHIGVVSHVPADGWAWGSIRVIHCSRGNFTRSRGKSAIAETDGAAWAGKQSYRGRIQPAWGSMFVRPVALGVG